MASNVDPEQTPQNTGSVLVQLSGDPFAFMPLNPLLKMGLLCFKICSRGTNSFLSEWTLFQKGGKPISTDFLNYTSPD